MEASKMKPKNVLYISSDEHQRNAVGCYGHPFVKTPTMDALAAKGTRFTNAYTPSPICVPGRAALATGRYVHENRCWDNSIGYHGHMESWGHVLQAAGHRVDSIGKLHYRSGDDSNGFENEILPMHLNNGVGSVIYSVKNPLPKNILKDSKIAKNIGPGESSYARYDGRIADEACQWLKNESANPSDKPWALFVSFVSPHYPLKAPEEFYGLYKPEDMPVPKCSDPNFEFHPWFQILRDYICHDDFFTPETRQIAMASYYGLCTYLDSKIAQVLKALEECGLEDDTRIIYASDHGEMLGNRRLWGKYNLYEDAAAVPLIIAGPDVPANQVINTPVSLIDLFQTVLHSVGLDEEIDNRNLPGKSLWNIANAPDNMDRAVFSEYHATGATNGAYMIRRGKFKYHYYVGFEPELFDMDADPDELNNLATDPQCQETLKEYESILRVIVNPEAADALAKSDQAEHIERNGGRDNILNKGAFAGTPPPGETDANA
jgi:choline-sulfatase